MVGKGIPPQLINRGEAEVVVSMMLSPQPCDHDYKPDSTLPITTITLNNRNEILTLDI